MGFPPFARAIYFSQRLPMMGPLTFNVSLVVFNHVPFVPFQPDVKKERTCKSWFPFVPLNPFLWFHLGFHPKEKVSPPVSHGQGSLRARMLRWGRACEMGLVAVPKSPPLATFGTGSTSVPASYCSNVPVSSSKTVSMFQCSSLFQCSTRITRD